MPYASIPHLIMHHAGRPSYGASTRPTASEALIMIAEAGAQLDFSLTKGGYDAPLLSNAPSSVAAFFQRANAMGALCMIESSAQQGHNRDDFCGMFKEACRMIENGELPGLDRNSEQSRPRFDDSASPPFFTRTMWL